MAYGVLPGIFLDWTTYPSTDFLRYRIWRRVLGDTDWLALASGTVRLTSQYTDNATESGVTYEYAVTVEVNIGGDVIESAKQSPAVQCSETHVGAAMHDVGDTTDYAVLQVSVYEYTPVQEVVYVHASGRQQPTAQYGELEATRISLTPGPQSMFDPEEWVSLRAMYTKQRETGAIYLFRPGGGGRYYVHIASLARQDARTLTRPAVELQEVFYDEEAAA